MGQARGTLCFPAVENLHVGQRSISYTTPDRPTCFPMNLPHFLNIFEIFVNFIEQRRLFFWVLCSFLKNFAKRIINFLSSAPSKIDHSWLDAKLLT